MKYLLLLVLLILVSLGFYFYIIFQPPTVSKSPPPIYTPSVSPIITAMPTTIPSLVVPPVNQQPQATDTGNIKNSFGEGQICGGKGNLGCPPEFTCRKEDDSREASGTCVKP